MRIAMIGAKGLPSLLPVGGGIETHVENLARHLCLRGHDVTVYVRTYANPQRLPWLGKIKLVTLGSWHRKNFDAITHVFRSTLHAISQDYDVIHYHGVGPSTLSWIPRLFGRRAKVVVTFHSRDQFHEKWGLLARSYLAFGEWTSGKFPHATIATNHGIQLLCRKLYGRDAWYIPNGVDIPSGWPGTHELAQFGLQPNRYFLCLARLVPHKAQDDVIRAFKKLDTSAKLAIVGSASFDDAVYAEKLKILAGDDQRIVFTGHQSGDVLHQLIAHQYALVHASRSEGLSVAVLEAMSYGKLVIMSNIPENMELIDHSGISFKVGSIAKLYDALRWSLEEPQLARQRGARGKEVIHKLYSWKAVVSKTEELYRSLVGEGFEQAEQVKPSKRIRRIKRAVATD